MACYAPPAAPRPSRRGFTLIEMLTVITIITILAAVSVSMIGRIKEGSKLTQCSSNLMQIGQGIQGYANDWTGYLPTTYQLKGQESGFAQYLGNSSYGVNFDTGYQSGSNSKCPKVWEFYVKYPGNSSSGTTIGQSAGNYWHINAMYGPSANLALNGANRAGLYGGAGETNFDKILKVNHVVAKSMFAIVFDGDGRWNSGQGVSPLYGPQFMHASLSKSANRTMLDVNQPVVRDGKSNTLFFDGSVRALAYSDSVGAFDEFSTMMCAKSSDVAGQSAAIRKKYQLFWNFVGTGSAGGDTPSSWAP